MYQQFFYAAVAICVIIYTIITTIFLIVFLQKNYSGRSSRQTSLLFDRIETLEEKQFDFYKQKLEIKIEIYNEILKNVIFVDPINANEMKKKIETLQESLNESND